MSLHSNADHWRVTMLLRNTKGWFANGGRKGETLTRILAGMLVACAFRADDGSNAVVPYTPGTAPGDWQPAPPALAAALLPGWGQVTPFGLGDVSRFRLPPPPGLRTGKYENDYNEVKRLGRIDSPFRPQ